MQSALNWLFNIDPSVLTPETQVTLTWDSGLGGWMLFAVLLGFAALVGGVFWLYRREMKTCPPKVRGVLAVLRGLTLAVLLVVLLGPTLTVNTQIEKRPWVLVMVDNSLSMGIRDAYLNEDLAGHVARFIAADGAGGGGDGGGDDLAEVDIDHLRSARPSRMELIEQLLSRDQQRFLHRLAGLGNYKVIEFADRTRVRWSRPADDEQPVASRPAADGQDADAEAAEGGDGQPPVPDEPLRFSGEGATTNLAMAIREAMASVRGERIAAIVLISDFRHTDGDDPREAAMLADERQVPIYTLGVGDSERLPDVRLVAMSAPETVWGGDPIEISATVEATGMANQPMRVAMTMHEDGREVPDRRQERQVTVGADGRPIQLRFETDPLEAPEDEDDEEGRVVTFAVEVEPALGIEDLTPDAGQFRRRARQVQVLSKQARVLIVAGSPTWEYRTVRALLQRDDTIDVSGWLQSMDPRMQQEGNTPIERLPQVYRDPRGEGYELAEYDAIIMFDPDPAPRLDETQFSDTWNEALETFVRNGGGLLFVAGPKFTGDFLSASHPQVAGIARLLPVSMGDATRDVLSRRTDHLTASFHTQHPLRPTPDADTHPIMQVAETPEENRAVWESLPGTYWAFTARKALPGFRPLLVHPSMDELYRGEDNQPGPLLVAGNYHSGRTVYMGFNSSWRWRRVGENATYFDRYWINMVRYLSGGRHTGDQRRGRILLDQSRYHIGDRVQVRASIPGEEAEAMNLGDTLSANWVVVRGDGSRSSPVRLELRGLPRPQARPDQAPPPFQYEGTIVPREPGDYEIAIDLPTTDRPVRIARNFTVEVPMVEYEDPTFDPGMWRALASVDPDNPERRFAYLIDQAGRIPDDIDARPETTIIPRTPQKLWDTPAVLLLLVTLLTLEWALRKGFRLM